MTSKSDQNYYLPLEMVQIKSAKKDATGSRSQQPTISAFFSPKPSAKGSSPIDLTLEDSDSDVPPKKRQKTNANASFWNLLESPARVTEAGLEHAGHAEQWRFEPASPDQPRLEKKLRTTAEEAARKMNHEAFKKRLLGENSTFIRKESSMDVDSEDHPAGDETDSSRHDVDAAFTSFQELLSKKRSKGKAPATHNKRVDEVGPSGETWTPLEKQVHMTTID